MGGVEEKTGWQIPAFLAFVQRRVDTLCGLYLTRSNACGPGLTGNGGGAKGRRGGGGGECARALFVLFESRVFRQVKERKKGLQKGSTIPGDVPRSTRLMALGVAGDWVT